MDRNIKLLVIFILMSLLMIGLAACDLGDSVSEEAGIKMTAVETNSRPVDFLNIRVSELEFEMVEGIQEGIITFYSESSFEPIPGEINFSRGEAVVDLTTYAEDEELFITVKNKKGKQLDQLSVNLDNVETIMASEVKTLDGNGGDFDINTPRFGFFLAPGFESTECGTDKKHNFYSFYTVVSFVDLGLDELNAVVRHMVENEEDSFFVDAQRDDFAGYSNYKDFSSDYGSANLRHDLRNVEEEDRMHEFYFSAGLDYVGHVCDDVGTFTGYEPEYSLIQVEEIDDISVEYGTNKDDAIEKLPNTVEGTLDDTDETTVILDVAWEADEDYDAEVPDDYIFEGTLSQQEGEEDDYTIPETLEKVQVTVTVEPLDINIVRTAEWKSADWAHYDLNVSLEELEPEASYIEISVDKEPLRPIGEDDDGKTLSIDVKNGIAETEFETNINNEDLTIKVFDDSDHVIYKKTIELPGEVKEPLKGHLTMYDDPAFVDVYLLKGEIEVRIGDVQSLHFESDSSRDSTTNPGFIDLDEWEEVEEFEEGEIRIRTASFIGEDLDNEDDWLIVDRDADFVVIRAKDEDEEELAWAIFEIKQ